MPARGRQQANWIGRGFTDKMLMDLLIAQSLRRWKEDCAPFELKRYARREWAAETCFLHPRIDSKHSSYMRFAAVGLIRMVQSLQGITRSRTANEDERPAGKASSSKPIHSSEALRSSIAPEDVGMESADSQL